MKRCDARMVRSDIADRLVWEWIRNLRLSDQELDDALKIYQERLENELEPKKERLCTIEDLIARNERKLDTLTEELSEFEGIAKETIREKIRELGPNPIAEPKASSGQAD